ncbi:hypothetical protein SS1G_03382 [Sclerotinia sclerotiorum 1980 UF-70]|uniref:Uncharacterized protein n=2 Tax=Sclerotinia sclerotiorum (strain ATCC 18683 / 1980 / Ss-1) TaxID=665079 RepID=A7EDJ2_SCLS1|nr:hypothetical protein SS1G_03382 [Sclerotinia sclerotiorum 1980 UF-70]APA10929.1 hypothetical protein sscle_07g056990 [Sclerotinia sclerotiorum 1980 UF-70]EDO00908.1 hypothetical protein SS1G_03382 [Sclerotinia sclerotiorum 1980 UF-70]
MKFSFASILFAIAAPAVVNADKTSVNVESVISSFFLHTPTLPAGASSTLATALASIDHAWTTAAAFTSFENAVISAAPSSLQGSILKSGYYYEQVATADWFTKKAPKDAQKAISSYLSEVHKVESSVFSKVATQTSKGAGAAATGVPAVGAMGVALAVGLGAVGMM